MNFDNMGEAGVWGVWIGGFLIAAAILIAALTSYRLKKGQIYWFEYATGYDMSGFGRLGFAFFMLLGGGLLIYAAGAGNVQYQLDIASNATRQATVEQVRDEAIADIESEGYVVVNLHPGDSLSGGSVELQGFNAGCTHMYSYTRNPEGKFVVIEGTGRPHTDTPVVVFTETGEAVLPVCSDHPLPLKEEVLK